MLQSLSILECFSASLLQSLHGPVSLPLYSVLRRQSSLCKYVHGGNDPKPKLLKLVSIAESRMSFWTDIGHNKLDNESPNFVAEFPIGSLAVGESTNQIIRFKLDVNLDLQSFNFRWFTIRNRCEFFLGSFGCHFPLRWHCVHNWMSFN